MIRLLPSAAWTSIEYIVILLIKYSKDKQFSGMDTMALNTEFQEYGNKGGQANRICCAQLQAVISPSS
jgi:hypothetical protein